MAKKAKQENLVWNAQVRLMMLAGEREISAFAHIASCDPSDAHRALDKLVGKAAHAETTEISTWAVIAIARAWKRYIAANGALTLGKAFNLESTISGGHKAVLRNESRGKTFDLAVLVQDLVDHGMSKTRAIETVALSNNRSVAQLTKALKPPTKAELAEWLRQMQS